jgi:hypothetical protein
MGRAIQDSGVSDHWFALSLARGCEPEPFTLNRFVEIFPYTNSERLAPSLEALVKADMFDRVGEDAYVLTDIGRETVEGIFESAHQALGGIEPLPKIKMDELNNLLLTLVEAIVQAPQPEEKWSFCYSRWTDPGRDVSGAVRTDQYLTDLYRFRDDAHIAAWKPYEVSGAAWEVLTFMWREEAKSPNELVEALSYRMREEEEYVQILRDLTNREWVEIIEQNYQVTAAGEKIRQEAEDRTDHIFFAPWESLNKDQINDLQSLLKTLKAELTHMANSNEE